MKSRYKILVVEDEEIISEATQSILNSHGYNVIICENGQLACEMIASHCPDLVLLDLGLPDMDGMEVLKIVRGWSQTPVIVVSARNCEADKVQALEAGADDYISKPFGYSELLARIKVALRHAHVPSGTPKVDVACYRIGGLVIDYGKRKVFLNDNDTLLTNSEFRLVSLLGKHAGNVLTYDYIIREMWGPNAPYDNQNLRVYITNIRRKIEPNPSKPRYIITVVGVGYQLANK